MKIKKYEKQKKNEIEVVEEVKKFSSVLFSNTFLNKIRDRTCRTNTIIRTVCNI